MAIPIPKLQKTQLAPIISILLTKLRLVPTIFNATNYGKWKRSMTLALSAKNKMAFEDWSFPKTLATPQDLNA